MRVRKLNESVKNAPANESFAVRHKNGNWVSKYYTVTSSAIPAKFNTREEAEKFISEDGKDPNWNKYYDIVELENEPLEEKLIEFDPNDWEEEDIKFWNHIDWQKNGYSDFARTDDTITAKVTKYSMHNDPETKEVTMCKYFRANPIYPPYYAAVEKPFDNCVGPMYDGHKAGKVDIHDRYETQEVYDLLSEAHNSNGEANKLNTVLQDCDDLKSNAVEKKFSIEKAKENIIDIYDTIRTIIKDHNMPHNQIADYVNSFIDCADMSGKDVKDTMFRIGGDYIERLFHSGNWNAYDFFRQEVDPNIKEIKHFIKNLCSKTNLTDRDIDFLVDFATELAKKKTEANLERAINSVPTMSDTLVGDNVEEGFLSKKAVKGEANKLTDFLTANADKIKSLADCAPYILDDISDVTINTAAAKDSEEMNTMIDIAGACAKEFGYPNFETLRADDDVEVHFEAAKYLSKFVDARRLGQVVRAVRDEIADCERIEEELLKEDLGEDVGEYQEWVDYDMKKYGRISKETFDKLRKADLTVVKDEYGDYEVIPHEKIHEACKKRKVDKKLEESIIYTSEGLNNAMKEFAKVVRDWKKTHVDSQEEKVIAESNWDDDSFNTFIATLEG